MGKQTVVFPQGVTSRTAIVSRLLSNDAARRVEPALHFEGLVQSRLVPIQ